MRNGQNKHRMRSRNRGGGKSHNPLTRVYESNGPDVKIRGTPNHVAEKYIQLARDATASGDPVAAENYYQHAEHYFRLIAAAQEQFRQNQPYQQREGGGSDESYDGDGDDQPSYGGGEPHSPQPYQQQPREQRDQPYQRDYQPRQEGRHDNRQQHHDNRQPRYDNRQDNRQANQHQDRPPNQGNGAQDEEVDRLPSFITGAPAQGAAQPGGDYEQQGGGDRFPLSRRGRRRNYRGPRNDSEGGDEAQQQGQPPAGE
jgi:hypothetical protein